MQDLGLYSVWDVTVLASILPGMSFVVRGWPDHARGILYRVLAPYLECGISNECTSMFLFPSSRHTTTTAAAVCTILALSGIITHTVHGDREVELAVQ